MARLPLEGIRVLDFCWAWAGPFCAMQLAHMGAEVIRVESAKRPCVTRCIPPFADDKPGPNRAGYFNQYNQGKRSLTLDLSKPDGLRLVYELTRHCDIAAENFAGGVAERMGLGYDKLREYRRDLIMISLSGYGQSGPFRKFVGYGPPAAALAGFYSSTGYEGLGSAEIGISYPDPNAGIFAASAIMAALIHRKRTGQGQYIDQSQFEAALQVVGEGLMEWAINKRLPERIANHDRFMSPHNCYKTKGDDDKWVTIAVGNEAEWRSLCHAIGQPALADDARFRTMELRKKNEQELDKIITAWTAGRDRWDVANLLQRAGVAAFPSMSNKDLTTDEHLKARGYLVENEHPEVGRRIHAGIPWTMTGLPRQPRAAAPVRGEANEYVLSELLNLSKAEIAKLQDDGVLN